ncbi:TolC family protein [Sphingobacterium sp. LRF_L2]|uniref:TolC family protein n=1 Tax=Sphingobacterium sp. LRF_L2 TaxID=3369421 RepID=UPI003F625293
MIRIFVFVSCFLLTRFSGFGQERWTLQRCIQFAQENNLEIQNSKINNGVKLVDLKIAKNEKLPEVSGFSSLYSKFGQGQDVFGNTRRNDNLNGEFGIDINATLYNHGKLKKDIKRTTLLVGVSEEEIRVLKRNIAIKVIEYYLAIQLNKEIARAVDTAVFYANLQYEKAVKTTNAGTTALTVQYEAKANLARENQQLKKAEQDVQRAKLNMVQLIQLLDYKNFDIVEDQKGYEPSSHLGFSLEDAIEQSASNHPELKKLKLLRRTTEIENEIAKADRYPAVRGSALIGSLYFNSLVSTGDRRFFPQIKDNFAQQVAITLSIPIFNKGRVRNTLAKNQHYIQQNDIQVKQQYLVIKQDVEKLYFDYWAYLDQYEAAQDMFESAEMALSFTSKSYEAGKSSIYDLNSSRGNLLKAESEMLQAKYNCLFVSKMIKFFIEETL